MSPRGERQGGDGKRQKVTNVVGRGACGCVLELRRGERSRRERKGHGGITSGSPMWQHERPKEVEKYDLLVEKKRVATRRKAGRRWRERKSQVDCSGACASLKWKYVRA